MGPLQAVVLREHRQPGLGREEQIPGFDEADVRPVVIDRQVRADRAQKVDAEAGDLDVDRGRELLADRARRERRRRSAVGRIAFDDGDPAGEARVARQKVGD
jgi:hypothetical protein